VPSSPPSNLHHGTPTRGKILLMSGCLAGRSEPYFQSTSTGSPRETGRGPTEMIVIKRPIRDHALVDEIGNATRSSFRDFGVTPKGRLHTSFLPDMSPNCGDCLG